MNPNRYAKAIMASLLASLGAYQAMVLAPGAAGLTGPQWAQVMVTGITAFAITWAVPNAPAAPPAASPERPSGWTQPWSTQTTAPNQIVPPGPATSAPAGPIGGQ